MTGAQAARGAGPEFVLLTGALGSGKTTLLKHYLDLPASRETGIIVNDAGAINVDGAILESGAGHLVTQAASGCICCSASDDLQRAVDAVLAAHARAGTPVRRIILETSGLASPGPIVRSLGRLRQRDFSLRIVATLDPGTDPHDWLPPYAEQLAAAQLIVVTKTDLCDEPSLDRARARARRFSPFAASLVVNAPSARAEATFRPTAAAAPHPISAFYAADSTASPRITILLARWAAPPAWGEIEEWLENVAGFCGDRLLRLKGLITPKGARSRILINAVGPTFSRPHPMPDGQTPEGLVLILRDMDADALARFSDEVGPCPPQWSQR